MSLLPRLAALAALLALPPAIVVAVIPAPEAADLVLVNGPEPETLDPAVAARIGDIRICSALFEPLVALDPETLAPRGAAARTWTADAGGVTFTLEPGLRWSNGAPLGAEDFVASWRRAAQPDTGAPLAGEVRAVAAGARALGPDTIRIDLASPRPDLLALLSLPAFAPVHLASVAAHGERFTRPEHLICNGPFTLERWEPGRRLRLARNPHHRDAATIALASIEALTTGAGVGGGDATAYQIYETGAADLAFALPARAAVALRAAGRPDLHERDGARTYFLRFNTTRAPLDDPAVRRALSAAIDREAICRYVLRGTEAPAWTLVPPGLGGYEGPGARVPRERGLEFVSVGVQPTQRNPNTQARDLEFLYPATDESAAQVGEVLQAAFARAPGLRIRLTPAEPKAAFAAVKALEYDIAWGNWTADYPDAASFLEIFRAGSGNNRTGFRDPGYDALLDAAAAAPDAAGRLALLRRAEERLLEAAPLAPLFRAGIAVLARPTIRGAVAVPYAHAIPWARLGRS